MRYAGKTVGTSTVREFRGAAPETRPRGAPRGAPRRRAAGVCDATIDTLATLDSEVADYYFEEQQNIPTRPG